jgi:hypothetical protein
LKGSEIGEGNEVFYQGHAVIRALAETDGAHLSQRADGLAGAAPGVLDAREEGRRNGAKSYEEDAEAAFCGGDFVRLGIGKVFSFQDHTSLTREGHERPVPLCGDAAGDGPVLDCALTAPQQRGEGALAAEALDDALGGAWAVVLHYGCKRNGFFVSREGLDLLRPRPRRHMTLETSTGAVSNGLAPSGFRDGRGVLPQLAANLASRMSDRVDVDVSHACLNLHKQIGHVGDSARASCRARDGIDSRDVSLTDYCASSPGPERQRHNHRSCYSGCATVDVRRGQVVDISGDELVVNRGTIVAHAQDGFSLSPGVYRRDLVPPCKVSIEVLGRLSLCRGKADDQRQYRCAQDGDCSHYRDLPGWFWLPGDRGRGWLSGG